jgi:hypothetical protein
MMGEFAGCGPVAQLGARFHGMEGVKGSNLSFTRTCAPLPVIAARRSYDGEIASHAGEQRVGHLR